jgi:N-acyl amino acid synthase of PEP-CTERM/exosortase system
MVVLGQMQFTLAAKFLTYFDLAFAATEARRQDVFGIRYSVYCNEFGYEPAHLHPDHHERDEFDHSAIHALITHNATGTPAGCVRRELRRGVCD